MTKLRDVKWFIICWRLVFMNWLCHVLQAAMLQTRVIICHIWSVLVSGPDEILFYTWEL